MKRNGFISLILVFAVCTNAQVLHIKGSDFLIIPETVKGSFIVASHPPRVETILFNGLPQSPGSLWSSWGDGCLASNGKYYTAIGDHRGNDGNSYVYEYDPTTRRVKQLVDIAKTIQLKPGQYGHGKIHAPILEYNGALYFATYWGKQREVPAAYQKGYRGSILFRYDLKTARLENLGAIAAKKGLPGAAIDSRRGLLYFYGVEGDQGDVVVYDLRKRATKFISGAKFTSDHRVFMHSRDGKLYFSDSQGKLSFYDPDKNMISTTSLSLPGPVNRLRAAARSTASGIIYGMTRAGTLFAFDTVKQTIQDLGPNFLKGHYNAVMVLSPDEKYLYFAPGSHGSAMRWGTPLIQYSITKRTRKVIAFLRQAFQNQASYNIAGNYNIQIDSQGATLYCTFNGSLYSAKKDAQEFGLPALVVIRIPEEERK